MGIVLLTALGVGGATVIGAAIGFAFKNLSHKFADIVLSFAAGVMLAAAVLGCRASEKFAAFLRDCIAYGEEKGLLVRSVSDRISLA